ncbi:hypothetical protein OQJ18_13420 [Fluoribacter dumoffii]|uniref:hypothetical protein n=1 Tax=Fluoribacter dumoffii TaxID=463 RepID=UPI002243BB59|nr:hypothetical protein [Fluoribacter dumoffii]MCW8416905.1 hypothetical protein [Fluoribacter dumoffii]MCW8455255.1 hypothetical protein [Fluoribacter dumoffii]MCW8460668.1 hypothetical protein [Fluoribacter dumoffii]MCW8484148.1 hypothetical protein [Fluoribacter dumoffii]
MKNIFNGFVVVALAVIIWILFSINQGIHHIERQLGSLDNNIYEIEMHTSGLEKPSEIMERRAQQRKARMEAKKLFNQSN